MAHAAAVDIFNDAIALPPEEWPAFLALRCGGDEALRIEVESLLGTYRRLPADVPPATGGDEHLPEAIGHYTLLGELGRGGMGRVFLAEDQRLGRRVALKMLSPRLRDQAGQFARLHREAQILASLHHPNIATLFSLERVDESPVLAMEWVPGETLAARLGRLGPGQGLGLDETARIGVQVIRALAYAHERGVVHRDLKPANIALTPGGEVKLLDFGLAKATSFDVLEDLPSGTDAPLPSATTAPSLTLPGLIRGSPGYMSPEQIQSGAVGVGTDIWALVSVLFECLAGTPAFPGESPAERMKATLEREPAWERLPIDTPVDFRRVLQEHLAKDPALRPSSVEGLRTQLERIALGAGHAGSLGERHAGRSGRGHEARSGGAHMPLAPPPVRVRRRVLLPALALCVAAGVAAWNVAVQSPDGDRPQGSDDFTRITFHRGVTAFDVSPDDRSIAYITGSGSLVLHDLASHVERKLHSARGLRLPKWSPDGRGVLVSAPGSDGQFRALVIDPATGLAEEVGPPAFIGMDWTNDGAAIVGGLFGTTGCRRLLSVERATGDTLSYPVDREIGEILDLDFAPSGDELLIFGFSEGRRGAVFVKDSLTSPPSLLPPSVTGASVHWARSGRSLLSLAIHASGSRLEQIPLEDGKLGTPKLLETRPGGLAFRLLQEGSAVFLCRQPTSRLWLLERESDGTWRREPISRPTSQLICPRLSPGAGQVAVLRDPLAAGTVVEIVSLSDRSSRELRIAAALDWIAWSPRGDQIAYRVLVGDAPTDGWVLDLPSGESRRAFGPSSGFIYWAPAEKLRHQPVAHGNTDYELLEPGRGGAERLLGDPPRGTVFQSSVSPDGRWMAVAGNRNEIASVAVWLIDLVERSERLLYPEVAVPIGWSRDGAWVYATLGGVPGDEDGESSSRIIQISVADGAVETVVDLPGGDLVRWSDVDISPEGDRVVAATQEPSQDLWLSRRGRPAL